MQHSLPESHRSWQIGPVLLLKERGRNIGELQELLGHRSLSTTARYTHINRERLKSVVADLALP
jgi:site-specific recombinase XerD